MAPALLPVAVFAGLLGFSIVCLVVPLRRLRRSGGCRWLDETEAGEKLLRRAGIKSVDHIGGPERDISRDGDGRNDLGFVITSPPQQRDRTEEGPTFRSVGDELQTGETFDHDIIDRMGARFYDAVFVPAITEARAEGKAYETIRDTIHRRWKPARAASR